jgi:hypothetical protein
VDCSPGGDALLLGVEEGSELSLAPSTCLLKLSGAGETERRMLGLGRRFARRITVGWPNAREILCEKRFANFGVGWFSCSMTCSPWLTGKDCRSGRASDRVSTPSTDGPREGVTGSGSLRGDSTVVPYPGLPSPSPSGEKGWGLSSPGCTEMQQSVSTLDSLMPAEDHEKGHPTETWVLTLGRTSQPQ